MWMRYGEEFDVNNDHDMWDVIVSYMDDEIREKVHMENAPCSNEHFLNAYIEEDRAFMDFLWTEFRIERDD